ncbi:MAG TPA: CPBP family intramembrane glutamic endopeptidase [Holophagaceae bacterium]|nr:CPBP family intramembrane glutamic endopeptidase [Holophagaceae bacterium]
MTLRTAFFNPSTGVLRAGWRIPWLILWAAPVFLGVGFLSKALRPHFAGGALLAVSAATGLLFILAALGVYRTFARVVERRRDLPELRLDGDTPRHAGLGFLLGGGTMLAIVAILSLAGSYHVDGANGPQTILKALAFYLPQSFSEDFIFCLILFRLLKEGLGRKWALLIAPVLFSAAHLGNDHESLLGLLEIVTAGVLMYYAFDRTGSFYTVWGLHFSWNFTMNGIFGLSNSGQAIPGLLRSHVTGPTWLTGGATGPEASVLALGFDVLLLLALLMVSDRRLRARVA